MKQNFRRLLKATWIKACRFDDIPIDSKFVTFSDDNPHAIRNNRLAKLCLQRAHIKAHIEKECEK